MNPGRAVPRDATRTSPFRLHSTAGWPSTPPVAARHNPDRDTSPGTTSRPTAGRRNPLAGPLVKLTMTIHRVRLRLAWEGAFPDGPRRVDLPVAGPPRFEFPPLLRRRFRAPRLASSSERLELELRSVAGLVEVRLNGQPVALRNTGPGVCVVPIAPGPRASDLLELVLDPAVARSQGAPWGEIALVIRNDAGPLQD